MRADSCSQVQKSGEKHSQGGGDGQWGTLMHVVLEFEVKHFIQEKIILTLFFMPKITGCIIYKSIFSKYTAQEDSSNTFNNIQQRVRFLHILCSEFWYCIFHERFSRKSILQSLQGIQPSLILNLHWEPVMCWQIQFCVFAVWLCINHLGE